MLHTVLAVLLFVAPLYIEYTSSSEEEFAREARKLKQRIPDGPKVRVGFSAFLNMKFADSDLAEADLIVQRARENNLPVHISVVSGFFHGFNALRETAIREDVRNAQWFADGWIAPPQDIRNPRRVPRTAWVTPSRYARPLRTRIEAGTRLLGDRLARLIEQFPETVHSISGDAEVEFTFERNLYADYSPFMIAEFRDWLRESRYAGDGTPNSDENGDGHTFNKDFEQHFTAWRLRYFDDSGPIPHAQYFAMREKLPRAGSYFVAGGFDAPRAPLPGKPLWESWKKFRTHVIAAYLRDFAKWITADSRIPASRFYTHQIPAEFLFEGRNPLRRETSASLLETAFIQPLASPGVTVFDTFNGKTHSKTSSSKLFQKLAKSGGNWGIMEYNPSVPQVDDVRYYLSTLRSLNRFHPTIIVPFAWTNAEQHAQYKIQNSAFERALREFVSSLH